jgi:hypothetical protein
LIEEEEERTITFERIYKNFIENMKVKEEELILIEDLEKKVKKEGMIKNKIITLNTTENKNEEIRFF